MVTDTECVQLSNQMRNRLKANKFVCRGAATLLVVGLLVGCGPKKIDWKEEVQLQGGEVITTRRTALAEPFGQIGGTGGWENEGMTVEVIAPIKPDNPGTWNAKFVPLVFDRDPDTKEWFMVATFFSCTSWYELGRPKLPYTEFRYRNGQWVQQPLSEKFIGREGNMFTGMRSSGETDKTLSNKRALDADTRIAPSYLRVVAKWETNC
jgi:hypothetical protein